MFLQKLIYSIMGIVPLFEKRFAPIGWIEQARIVEGQST
jgi:hypothetical protein